MLHILLLKVLLILVGIPFVGGLQKLDLYFVNDYLVDKEGIFFWSVCARNLYCKGKKQLRKEESLNCPFGCLIE